MSHFPDIWRGSNGLFREMNHVQRLMDRLVDDNASRSRTTTEPALWSPSCELTEEKDSFVARFELPGVSKDQIKVELNDNQLTVRAERRSEKKDEKKHYSEFSYGSFMRAFTLPAAVSDEKVNAAFEGGILTVTMQKTASSGARQISVK